MTTFYPVFDPSSLRAGADDLVSRPVTYAAGTKVVAQNTVLGRVSGGGAGTGALRFRC